MTETDAVKLREIAALIREGRDQGTPLPLCKAIAKLGELPDDGLRLQKIEAQSLVRKAMKSGSRLELERALTEVDRMATTQEEKPAEKVKPKRGTKKRARKKARGSKKRRD